MRALIRTVMMMAMMLAFGVVRGEETALTAIPYANADGTSETLAQYKGKVLLIVNTASKCGFTKQYADLQAVYDKYKDRGLVVVAFPANDFGHQEPGTNAEIQQFCSTKFGVTFPVKGKMVVKGDAKSPLYKALTGETSPKSGEVLWNFEKFLIDRDGKIVERWRSMTKPTADSVTAEIEKALGPVAAAPAGEQKKG